MQLTTKSLRAGLLVPVFALRRAGDFGIGDTRAVIDALEYCAEHAFSFLQILPIHENLGDYSPYNAISSRALSPSLLTVEEAAVPGLTREIVDTAASPEWLSQLRAGAVKYSSVQPLKLRILSEAHRRFITSLSPSDPLRREFESFKNRHREWLEPYTLFRYLACEYEGNPNFEEWRPEHQTWTRAREWVQQQPDHERLDFTRDGFAFVQWVAWRQWRNVRARAEALGVALMGEMSFGVGRCSADVWAHPELFELDWNVGSRPIVYFDTNKDSERWGQNWGLPPYRWEQHRAGEFAWLKGRITWEAEFFHACRLDHLRGYFRVYIFPWKGGPTHSEFAKLTVEEVQRRTGGRLPRFLPGADEDAGAAAINYAQGQEILSTIKRAAGDMLLVGEIMGEIPDYMQRALDELSLSNLTFPQLERTRDRSLRPREKMRVLSLACYANHDHAPLAAFYLHLLEQAKRAPNDTAALDLANLLRWIGWESDPPEQFESELLEAFQRALLRTPCFLAAFMSSDVFGTEQRFNLPGSYGPGTWSERLEYPLFEYDKHPLYGPRAWKLTHLISENGRLPKSGENGRKFSASGAEIPRDSFTDVGIKR